jgi:Uma2 family endonuclease
MAVQEKLYTVEEFWTAFGAARHIELVKGVPIQMTPTGTAHMIVAAWLTHLLTAYADARDLGVVTASEGGFVLSHDPAIVRAPDVGFIAKTRLTTPTSERFFDGAPDFAVEVVSPGDTATDIHDKVMEFLHAGTRLIWVVYPRSKTVMVYTPDAEAHIFDANGQLDGGEVLPGFTLPVRDVFKKLQD